MITQQQIEQKISTYHDPYLQSDLLSVGAIKQIAIAGDTVTVKVVMGYPVSDQARSMRQALVASIKTQAGVRRVQVDISSSIASHAVRAGVRSIKGVRNVIAVASGKGGVGKSTVAVNMATALYQQGATVGLLDADIYGPSLPKMLGLSDRQDRSEGQRLQPVSYNGIQSMSMGYLIDIATPVIWRGPMVSKALWQLFNDTQWDNLDYLIVDLPPGTGDVQLTLAQKIPVSGAVIVTTPQDIALVDARRGLAMFRQVDVPVLGVVENMGMYTCSHCGNEEFIFGLGGGARIAAACDVPLLGSVPLYRGIREAGDVGNPIVSAEPCGPVAKQFSEIARRTAAALSLLPKNISARFPPVVVEN